jgi:hypothetical protein
MMKQNIQLFKKMIIIREMIMNTRNFLKFDIAATIFVMAINIFLLLSHQVFADNRVASGSLHTIAVTTLSKAQCTGANNYGQCNVGSWSNIEQVAAGEYHSVGLESDGDVVCVGWNNNGQCDTSWTNIEYIAAGFYHTVGIVTGGTVLAVGQNAYLQCEVSSWAGISEVSAGMFHTVGLKTNNTVVCAGQNIFGECNVTSWTDIVQISAGANYTLGLKRDGSVLCVGDNSYGQCNNSGWGNIEHISAGSFHSVAVDDNNEPYATGLNEDGQCDVSTWTVISDVVAGSINTIGVLEDGQLSVVGSTSSYTTDVNEWQLVNTPPYIDDITIYTLEDNSKSTPDLYTLASDEEGHALTINESHSASFVITHPTASNGNVINNIDGTYTYSPDPDFNGSDSFTYTITEVFGQTTVNYTSTAVVSVVVTPVNDQPLYSASTPTPITEDLGPRFTTIASWASAITAGAYNEGSQSLSVDLTWTCADESIVLTPPALSSITANSQELTLTYAFAEDQYGDITITVTLTDDAGRANSGMDEYSQTYVITCLSSNDAPTFTKGPDLMTVLADSLPLVYSQWATHIYTGADNEPDSLTFTTIPDDPSLFSGTLEISSVTGSLCYTLSGTSGETTLTIQLDDSGGTENSGVNFYTNTFVVRVLSVIHDGPGGVANTVEASTLQLWLEADELTGLSDTDALTSWEDAYGYSMICSDCPTYDYSFSNSLPAVVFNGSSNFFEDTSSAFDFQDATGMAVFAVMSANTTSGYTYQTIVARDSSSDRGWGCQIDSSDQLYFSIANSESMAVTCQGTAPASNSITIVSFIFDGVRYNDMDVYNSQTNVSGTIGYTIPDIVGGDGPKFTIGKDGDDDNFFDGSIAELIVYDRVITSVEQILINNYLSSKYNIALSANDKYTGDNAIAGDYDMDVAGIGLESDGINRTAISAGMVITNLSFLKDSGDYLLFGHRVETNAITVTNLPETINMAWEREWMIHKTDVGSNGGNIQIGFDIVLGGVDDQVLNEDDYVLLRKTGQNDAYAIFNSSPAVYGDLIIFEVNTASINTGDCFTLGSTINYALDFNGNEYLVSETAIDLSNTAFTIEYWAKPDPMVATYLTTVGQGINVDYKNLHMGFTDTDHIFFGFDDTHIVETTSAYTDTNWHHFAFSYSNTTRTVDIYVDSILEESAIMSGDYSGSGILYIGTDPVDLNKCYYGYLDEVRIWSGSRDIFDIISNQNKILDGDETDLLAYWQFNEGALLEARDKTADAVSQILTPSSSPPTWIESSLPIGTSIAQTERVTTLTFTDTNLDMIYDYHHSETVVVTRITTPPNNIPSASEDVLDLQYWVVNRTGNTTFNAGLSFQINEDITNTNDNLYKLLWRENGSTGAWTDIAYASTVTVGADNVLFKSMKTTGQFMIVLDNYNSIAGSGTALNFDGSNFAVDETNSINIANSDFTIEFWARNPSATPGWIIGHNDTAQGLTIGFSSTTSTFECSMGNNKAYSTLANPGWSYWHHWAISFDSTDYTQTIYFDGEWLTENTATGPYDLTGNFYIGCGAAQYTPFTGQIDDVRVWSTVRTETEIQANMYSPLNGAESDLLAYWRMDEPWSYTYITDVHSNASHCAISGTMSASDLVDSIAWSERTIDEDVGLTIIAGYDLEGDALDNITVSLAAYSATVTAFSDYSLTYSPNANIYGTDRFKFKVVTGGTAYPITITILPINDAPEIGIFADEIIAINAVGSINFTVTDLETEIDSLSITPTSDNQTLISDANILIVCSSAGDCTCTITPTTNESGAADITFTVEDPEGLTAVSVLSLTVNTYPTIASFNNYTTSVDTAKGPIDFTIADAETAADELDLTFTTSDSSIISITNVYFTKDVSGDCTITLTPTTSAIGIVTIEVLVTDAAGLTASSIFDITVVNNYPTIDEIDDITRTINVAESINFNVSDFETENTALELTLTTSDSMILPIAQIHFSDINIDGSCTLSLTPTAYEEGTVNIEVIVSDGQGYSDSTSFVFEIIDMPGSGYMMSFDGSYSATTTQTLTLDTHTIEAWIKTTNNSWNGIVSTDDSSGKWAQMSIAPSGVLSVQIFNAGGQEKAYSGSTVINDNNWHHVAYVYDSGTPGTLNMYVDGFEETTAKSVNQTLTSFSLNEEIYIGGDSEGLSYFSGIIDEVRIWGSARSIDNIRDNMCIKVDPSSLMAYYRFDQTFGDTLYDLTSNNNDCTNSGENWTLSSFPIGDASVHDYELGDDINLDDNNTPTYDRISVDIANTEPIVAAHLYRVNQTPNTTSNDFSATIHRNYYYGLFLITTGSVEFAILYYADNDYSNRKLGVRLDNSTTTWTEATPTFLQTTRIILNPYSGKYEFIFMQTP